MSNRPNPRPLLRRRLAGATAALLAIALLSLGAAVPAAAAEAPGALVLILDASGSMWGRMGGEEKIVVARRVLGELVAGLPAETEAGLVAYGHRREGDCADVETVVALGPLDRAALTAAIQGLNPKGKTPITTAAEQAIALVRGHGGDAVPATVVLVSDGLETCNADPCAAVRAARESGVDFVLHVVGFGVEEGDVSQLECTAQAGGGLYFAAGDAGALAAALGRAVEAPPAAEATLSVGAAANGEPIDALVVVTGGGEEVAAGRTYTGAETNPRVFGLAAGEYEVEVRPVRIDGAAPVRFSGVRLAAGDAAERSADFSTGELAVGVTRNGELSDATVTVRRAGGKETAASGRTYNAVSSNPRRFELPAGDYDVEVGALEIGGKPVHRWEKVTVRPGERVDLVHEFPSGTLRIGATAGGELADATVTIRAAADGSSVAAGRTYTGASTNPKSFVLAPGSYRVAVKPVRVPGAAAEELTVEVVVGETVERTVVVPSPG
jgi:Ca-activated chloride channel family protein